MITTPFPPTKWVPKLGSIDRNLDDTIDIEICGAILDRFGNEVPSELTSPGGDLDATGPGIVITDADGNPFEIESVTWGAGCIVITIVEVPEGVPIWVHIPKTSDPGWTNDQGAGTDGGDIRTTTPPENP